MNQTRLYLLAFLILLGALFTPGLIADVAGSDLSYWAVFGMLVAVVAVIFGIWAFYGESRILHGIKGNTEGTPRFKFYKRWLGWLFWAFIACCIISCDYKWAMEEPVTTVTPPTSTEVWSADNIPLPHLTDGSQYVSNPDGVISQATTDSLNLMLRQLDTNLEVESAIIIVNRIYNADAFRMAQDVGNKVGVGTKERNRGLVVVVSYLDHKYFIAPGTGLEADLTDAECSQLARAYLTPSLKAEDPDQAMLKFISGLSSLLEGKDMPSTVREGDDASMGEESFSFLMLIIWLFFYSGLNKKYRWLEIRNNGGTGYTGFGRDRTGMGNTYWGSGWPTGRGGGFGGGFGGGGFGGGYGGGSFGGGGAGGGW